MKKLVTLITIAMLLVSMTSCNRNEPMTIWIDYSIDNPDERVVMAFNEELNYSDVPSADTKVFVAVMSSDKLAEYYEELANAKSYDEAVTILEPYELVHGQWKDMKRA